MSGKSFVNMSPQIVQAFFCLALQFAFRDHPQYKWLPDRSKTDLIIQTDMAENVKEASMRPAIIVEQGNLRFNNDSIGNRAHIERYKEYLLKEDLQYTVNGSIMLHILTETKLAADNLAYEVSSFFAMVHSGVAQTLQLQALSMPQQIRANPRAREGGDTTFDAIVSLDYSYAVRKEMTPLDLGPLLDDVFFVPGIDSPTLGNSGNAEIYFSVKDP